MKDVRNIKSALMGQLMNFCHQINTTTKANCTLYYNGSCGSISVALYRDGWTQGAKAEDLVCLYGDYTEEDLLKAVTEVAMVLGALEVRDAES